MKQQRKPDLAAENYSELEEKVDALMSKEKDLHARKKRQAMTDDTEAVAITTAPELPTAQSKDERSSKNPSNVATVNNTEKEDNKASVAGEKTRVDALDTSTNETDSFADSVEETSAIEKDVLSDEKTDEVVTEIIAAEADQLLDGEQSTSSQTNEKIKGASRLPTWIRTFFAWFAHGPHRGKVFVGLFVAVCIVAVFPASRYAVLNAVGVRSSMSIIIVDESTQQPLRNVSIGVGDSTSMTNEQGEATLYDVRLGDAVLDVERRAFASRQVRVTIGWGSNPLGIYSLYPTGVQYTFQISDFLTNDAVSEAEVVFGETTAFADEKGIAVLTISPEDDAQVIEVDVVSKEYRKERVEIEAPGEASIEVSLAPRLQHFFISERSGLADVYAVYADGKEEQVVLPGTGEERKDMKLLAHPDRNIVAISSTRRGDRNQDGFLLSNLTIINLDEDDTITADTSERLQLVGWNNDRLIYVKIAQGTSGTNPERHQLISYDYQAKRRYVLSASNYFNGVILIDDVVYFAPSSLFQETREKVYRVNADGSNETIALSAESWGLYRTSFNQLSIVTSSSWYSYDIQTWEVEELPGEPARTNTRRYVPSSSDDAPQYAWVDQRDGQGVLMVYDQNNASDQIVRSESGLTYPVRWLNNDAIVYRIQTVDQTADYVVSVRDGSAVKKIVDVTASNSVEQWY